MQKVPLKRLCTIVSGTGFPNSYQGISDESIPFYKVGSLSKINSENYLNQAENTISYDTAKALGATLIPPQSSLMAKIGAAVLLKRVAINAHESCIDNNMMAIIPKPNIHPKYLFYLLQTIQLEPLMNPGAVPNLNMEFFRNTSVSYIPWEEQKKIADKLDRELAEIDKFIAECAQLSALTDERRLAAINSVIEPLLDNTTPIKHLGTLTSGLTLGATYNEPLESYPYLRVANVQAGSVDLTEIKEVTVPLSIALENMLQKEDVLMTEGGDKDKLGRGAIWSGKISPMLHQNHVFAFRCNKEKLLPEFLVYCLESSYARRYFENNARQSTNLASTNSTIVKNFKIPTVSIDEQQKIINSIKSQMKKFDTMNTYIEEILRLEKERKRSISTNLM